MSADRTDGMWAVIVDDNKLEIIELERLVNECRKAFTSSNPRLLRFPILSVCGNKKDAEDEMEALKGFEEMLG